MMGTGRLFSTMYFAAIIAPTFVPGGTPTGQHKNVGISIKVHVLDAEPIGTAVWSLHAQPLAICKALQRLTGPATKHLHIVNGRLGISLWVWFPHFRNDFERELRQVRRDLDRKSCAR